MENIVSIEDLENILKESISNNDNTSNDNASKENITKECIGSDSDKLLPREKCLKYGIDSLTDSELLAIILRTGTREMGVMELSEHILHLNPRMDGLVSMIYQSPQDYMQIPGIGKCKSVELCAVGEIAKRIWRKNVHVDKLSFNSASLVYDYFKEELRYLDREVVHILYLDNRMQLLKDERISIGTCNHSNVSVRDIIMGAFKARAVCMIMVHNHPSGDPTPSADDGIFTDELSRGGDFLGIKLLDHIVIGDNCYYSFKEEGRL